MRNVWLQAGQKHMTRESKLLKSLVKRERGEHVCRANFKRSLEIMAIGPVEIDRSSQKKQDFSKNTCLKTSLHKFTCEQGNTFLLSVFSHGHLLPLNRIQEISFLQASNMDGLWFKAAEY